jgi:hypothetical protein
MKPPILVAAAAVVIALSGCSPAAPAPSAAPTGPVVGVIAIGHSGLTGEGTGAQYEAVLENSWATGTSPDVSSVYSRLVAVLPETEGHVANAAAGGAKAHILASQAASALRSVPLPALVIISTIDNDIRCDGTDEANLPKFGADVAAALDKISTASPDSTILIVGQLGRPDADFIQGLVVDHPEFVADLSGPPPCSFYNPDGTLSPENFAALTAIIDGYEAEEARVCAEVPHCYTDGGVRASYIDTVDNFGPDFAHLNVKGQAAEAELIWPVVESVLGI